MGSARRALACTGCLRSDQRRPCRRSGPRLSSPHRQQTAGPEKRQPRKQALQSFASSALRSLQELRHLVCKAFLHLGQSGSHKDASNCNGTCNTVFFVRYLDQAKQQQLLLGCRNPGSCDESMAKWLERSSLLPLGLATHDHAVMQSRPQICRHWLAAHLVLEGELIQDALALEAKVLCLVFKL